MTVTPFAEPFIPISSNEISTFAATLSMVKTLSRKLVNSSPI